MNITQAIAHADRVAKEYGSDPIMDGNAASVTLADEVRRLRWGLRKMAVHRLMQVAQPARELLNATKEQTK